MSSTGLTVQKIELINHLVQTVGLVGPEPGVERRMQASHTAAMRVMRGPIDESELRAVIYDALFRSHPAFASRPMGGGNAR